MTEVASAGEPQKKGLTVEEIPLEDLEELVIKAGAPKDTARKMKLGWPKHLSADSRTIADTLGAASLEGNPPVK